MILNKEAEKFNNPTDFSKYGKIQRKVSQLEKKLNEIKIGNGEEASLGLFNSLLSDKFIQFSYFKTFITLVLIISKVCFIYFLSDKSLFFRDYNFVNENKSNLILQYFRDDNGFIKIPIRYIIILVWTLLF
jgi:hypothetical protein